MTDAVNRKPFAIVTNDRKVVPNSILDRYAVKAGETKQVPGDVFKEKYGSLGLLEPIYNLEALAQLMEINSYQMRCVKAKAMDTAGLGWKLKPADEQSGTEPSEEQYLLGETFLDSIRPSLSIVLSRIWSDYEAIGNGYMEVIREEDNPNLPPSGIAHIPGHTMRVHVSGEKYCQIRGNRSDRAR